VLLFVGEERRVAVYVPVHGVFMREEFLEDEEVMNEKVDFFFAAVTVGIEICLLFVFFAFNYN
jgi:hypothetical protein